jgi:hypothetical protein
MEAALEWARSLPKAPGDERLCPWSPNMQHRYHEQPDTSYGYAAMVWVCDHCGEGPPCDNCETADALAHAPIRTRSTNPYNPNER